MFQIRGVFTELKFHDYIFENVTFAFMPNELTSNQSKFAKIRVVANLKNTKLIPN